MGGYVGTKAREYDRDRGRGYQQVMRYAGSSVLSKSVCNFDTSMSV